MRSTGPDPSAARAWIRDTPVDATGDVSVTATQAWPLTATVGTEGRADAQLDGVLTKGSATDGVSGGGLLRVEGTRSRRRSSSSPGLRGTIEADGDITVSASDSAAIESRSTIIQSAIVENTAAGIAAYLSGLLPTDNDFTTKSGTSGRSRRASRVRIAADDGGLGVAGHVYEYEGTTATIDLGSAAADYLNTALWTAALTLEPVLADFYPGIGNLDEVEREGGGDPDRAQRRPLDRRGICRQHDRVRGRRGDSERGGDGSDPLRGDEHRLRPPAGRSTAAAR